jgi:hypothetical protein
MGGTLPPTSDTTPVPPPADRFNLATAFDTRTAVDF